MDIAFEILIPSGITLAVLDFHKPSFEWQGQNYPQGFPQCAFGAHFMLVETPIPNHINAFLPLNMKHIDWRCFSVRGDGLDIIKRGHLGEHVEWQGKGLSQLLDAILGTPKQWVVVFEVNCDRIDKIVRCGAKDVLALIESSLVGGKEGFVAISA